MKLLKTLVLWSIKNSTIQIGGNSNLVFFFKETRGNFFFIPTITDSKDYNAIAKEIHTLFIKKTLNLIFGCRSFQLKKKYFKELIPSILNLDIALIRIDKNSTLLTIFNQKTRFR